MQIQFYTIPVFDYAAAMEEMNKFLRGHRVLDVQQELISSDRGAYWAISIRYMTGANVPSPHTGGSKKERVDYKEVLDEKVYEIFNQLRDCRKTIAEAEAVPVYAVFSNAELAKIAALPELLPEKLQSIKGIGSSKAEKYGKRIIDMYQSTPADEKGRPTDT